MKHVSVFFALFLSLFFLQESFASDTIRTVTSNQATIGLLDSLIKSQSDTNNFTVFPILVRQDSVPIMPNELVLDRLSCLQGTIPLHYNKYVQGFVNYFTIRNRKYTRRVLERQNIYFPLFEKYLAQYNLPQELKYLAVVESALIPRAQSKARAVGLWQFMSPTAGDFSLKITPFIDERMDPEKATIAACKYLKQLYRIFNDWELVLAAYNFGPGNIKKAIARSGGKKNYWEIYPFMPQETRSYVPTFSAIVYTMNHALDHEIIPDTVYYAPQTDTVLINQSLDLAKFSAQLNLAPDEITKLNPEIRNAALPATIKNYPLKVPVKTRELLAYNRTAILDSCRLPIIQPAPKTMIAAAPPVKKMEPLIIVNDSAQTDSVKQKVYIVAKGDNLFKIARTQNVTLEQLKEWNKIDKQPIVTGQKLVLFAATKLPDSVAVAAPLLAQADIKLEKDAFKEPKSSRKSAQKNKKVAQQVQQIHAVQPGDTLWNISKKYNNIPVDKIKQLNKLKSNELKPGQKLVIS